MPFCPVRCIDTMQILRIKSLSQYSPPAIFRGGQAVLCAVIFFLAALSLSLFSITAPVLSIERSVHALLQSQRSLFLAEGGIEDAVYRIRTGKAIGAQETVTLGSYSAVTDITTVSGNEKQIVAVGDVNDYQRALRASLTTGVGADFSYGVQLGDGGLVLENTSRIAGNVYSNGPVDGAGSNLILGSAVSAGPGGLIRDVHATSSAYAHNIIDVTIDADAHYQSISGSTVGGTSYPGSPDQATSTLPITDAMVAAWESGAVAGGTITSPCPYTITSNVPLGPVKINCDLIIEGSPTVTLGGPVWVTGNITVKNTPLIRIASSLGTTSVAVIADNPANQMTSSAIGLQNSALFSGSGSSGSYVLMLSQNRSAEAGGSEKAVIIKNNVSGALLAYAGHGEVQIENSVNLKEVTAYRVRLKNNAEVLYETGLANLSFSSGPGGGWEIKSWGEK